MTEYLPTALLAASACAGAAYGYFRDHAKTDRSGWVGIGMVVLLLGGALAGDAATATVLMVALAFVVLFLIAFGFGSAAGGFARRVRRRSSHDDHFGV